jgi:glucarate dehydratase
MPQTNRRTWLLRTAAALGIPLGLPLRTGAAGSAGRDLTIKDLRITPIALPDPPLLAAGGCHGPYFLRNVIELETNAGITGIGETRGGKHITEQLEKCRQHCIGQNVFAYRSFAPALYKHGNSTYAGIELACLDAIGRATGRRLCELLGGPVREQVEFASYLFFRYASDHPEVLNDSRLVDERGRGDASLDQWGDVRTPEAMAELAWRFHQKFGFRVHKLKAGVFDPQLELDALAAINDRFEGRHLLRIDPNARWTVPTALNAAKRLKELPLEYYEDPVAGQRAMADVRSKTGLKMSTNSCVTRFHHIPDAIRTEPIDIVLGDHHGWGGITAFQTLGTITEILGWGLSQHSNNHAGVTMAAMIHAGAITPQLTIAGDTHYVWLPDGADIIEGPNLSITQGHMQVPSGVGLGVTLDQDKLAQAHEIYVKSNMRNRDDAATMQKFMPGWKRTLF